MGKVVVDIPCGDQWQELWEWPVEVVSGEV